MPPTLSLVSSHLFSSCISRPEAEQPDVIDTEHHDTTNQEQSNNFLTPLPNSKRDRSPSLNRLSPFTLSGSRSSSDFGQDQDYFIQPPSPKRRTPRTTPRPSADSTPRGTCNDSTPRNKDGKKIRPSKWTPPEDDCLREAVKRYGARNWRAIAAMVPGRTHTQCLQHWSKVLKPGLVKGNWSKDEDAQLSHLVKSFAPEFMQPDFDQYNREREFAVTANAAQTADWTYISNHIPGRTTKQCRERWFHHLDPSLKHGPFDEKEDEILMAEWEIIGSKWSLIASKLRGRTADAVKIRHITLSRLRAAGRPTRPPPIMHMSSNSSQQSNHHSPLRQQSAPAMCELEQHHNPMHRSISDPPSRVMTIPNLPPDHPLHDMHMKSYRHANIHSRSGRDVEHGRYGGHVDTPRPNSPLSSHHRHSRSYHTMDQEQWINSLARRLNLPPDAKRVIQAKCDSMERDLRRPLLIAEREKVAKVISEACQSIEPKAPPQLPFENHDLNRDHTHSHVCNDTELSLSPTKSPISAPVDMEVNSTMISEMKKSISSNSINSLTCPQSPLNLMMGEDQDHIGLTDILEDGLGFSFGPDSIVESSLLRELQDLDNVDLRLSTDAPAESVLSLHNDSEAGNAIGNDSKSGNHDNVDNNVAKNTAEKIANNGADEAAHDDNNRTLEVPVASTTPLIGDELPVNHLASSSLATTTSVQVSRPVLCTATQQKAEPEENADLEFGMIAEWANMFGAANEKNMMDSIETAEQPASEQQEAQVEEVKNGDVTACGGLMCV